MAEVVKPYKDLDSGKKEQVRMMFNNIAGRYDFLNHLLSLGIDKRWRKKAIKLLKDKEPKRILDVATGTGDFAIEALVLNPTKVVGMDLSEQMLEVGKQKMIDEGHDSIISMETGDAENMRFETGEFDAVTVGFGVRNFENLNAGLKEINRVLAEKGTLAVLEFSQPHSFPFKQIYQFYFTNILPVIGRILSGDKRAYTYLHESVNAFPEGEDFVNVMTECGFSKVDQHRLMFGIASIYVGKK